MLNKVCFNKEMTSLWYRMGLWDMDLRWRFGVQILEEYFAFNLIFSETVFNRDYWVSVSFIHNSQVLKTGTIFKWAGRVNYNVRGGTHRCLLPASPALKSAHLLN